MTSKAGQQPGKRTANGLTITASAVAVAHTYLSFAAFFTALFVGCALHYKKIVKNGVAGYPEEWFPSVSATCVHLARRVHPAARLPRRLLGSVTGIQNEISFRFS